MKEIIQNYYLSELNTSYISIVAGVVFVVIGIILWKLVVNNQLLNGIKWILLLGGVFYLTAGIIYNVHTRSRITDISQIIIHTNTDNNELLRAEINRMNNVVPLSYIGSFILGTLMLILGIVLFKIIHKNFVRGIAVGLVILGLYSNVTEFISLQKNIVYQKGIEKLNQNNTIGIPAENLKI
jgi:hypothetical protein